MSTDNYIVGIDIGTTKIAVVVGRKNENGKCEIVGYSKTDSIGVNRGKVINLLDTSESIKRAIAEAQQISGVEIKNVFVGIASQHICSLQTQGELIRKDPNDTVRQEEILEFIENMYKINTKPGDAVINVIPQEYIIDDEITVTNIVGMMAKKINGNFHVIICKAQSVSNIEKCVDMCNLKVADVVLEPIASSSSVLSDDEKEAGVALIDIGGGTTDIAIFYDGIIRHTAVIPLGGEIITEDIRLGCGIIKKYAEQLKIQHGSAWALQDYADVIINIPGLQGRPSKEISKLNLAYIIQARMNDIIELVNQHIKNSGFQDKLGGGIVLTGGGALLSDIATLIKYKTGYDTRLGLPNEHLSHQNDDQIGSPIFATGVGLVIEGFKYYDNQVENTKNQGKSKPETSLEEKMPETPQAEKAEEKTGKTFIERIRDFFSADEIK